MKDKLIRKLREGDAYAFEAVMRQYSGYIYAVIRNHSRDMLTAEDMEELTVDTFTALWLNRESIAENRPLIPYLAVTARNKTLNRLRTVRFTEDIDELMIPTSGFESNVEQQAAIDDILTAAESLGQRQRDIFIRYYIYGESLETIAEKMKLSPANARTTLFRAREAVKKRCLKGDIMMNKDLLPFDREDIGPERLGRMIASAERKAGITRKEPFIMSKKAGKRSAATAIILAAALVLAVAAGAAGIGYIANHKDIIDSYFGAGAGDRIEQQGHYQSVELCATEHFRIMQEATMSTGWATCAIVTAEATDEEGKALIAQYEAQCPKAVFGVPINSLESYEENGESYEEWASFQDTPDGNGGYNFEQLSADVPAIGFIETKVFEAFGDNLETWLIRPRYGEGYMSFMYIFELKKIQDQASVPLELYMTGPDGQSSYLCTVELSTRPDSAGKRFVSGTTGRALTLFDYAMFSDVNLDLVQYDAATNDTTVKDIVIEYSNGSTNVITQDDSELIDYFDSRSDEEKSDGDGDYVDDAVIAGYDTRAVFSHYIDSQNVEAVVIDGERFTAE